MPGVNRSVTKALEILDLLGQVQGVLRLKEIALHLGLPESTTHRLLASLAERGYVQQRTHNGDYALGWQIVTLAQSLSTELRLVQNVRPCLEKLRSQVRHAVNLAVLSDSQVTYLDCLVPNHSPSLFMPPGFRAPAHATALGKVLLAHLPTKERDAVLGRLSLRASTTHTVTSLDALRSILLRIQEDGYAVDRGEFVTEVNCVAAPIKGPGGETVAAISVTMREQELPERWEEDIVSLVCATAAEASRRHAGIVPIAAGRAVTGR
ncbi:MAG: IclR family transcriptional regulator [Thermomicrobiales bacterium]